MSPIQQQLLVTGQYVVPFASTNKEPSQDFDVFLDQGLDAIEAEASNRHLPDQENIPPGKLEKMIEKVVEDIKESLEFLGVPEYIIEKAIADPSIPRVLQEVGMRSEEKFPGLAKQADQLLEETSSEAAVDAKIKDIDSDKVRKMFAFRKDWIIDYYSRQTEAP